MSRKPPDVIYIGLQKTGSTFLRHYLYAHPAVTCTREGIFFQTPQADVESRGADAARAAYLARLPEIPQGQCHVDMYEALAMGYLFEGPHLWEAQRFIMPDASLSEMGIVSDPRGLARRMQAAAPGARILITIRAQGDWFDSNYRHFFEQLPQERRSLRDFLATPEGRLMLDAARYDETVATYDACFGESHVLVLPLELIEGDEHTAISLLSAFLRIEACPYPEGQRNYNRGRSIESLRGESGRTVARGGLLARLFGGPTGTRDAEKELRQALVHAYAASNLRLALRTGIDLARLGYPT